MIYTQHFFVGNEYLGSSDRLPVFVHEQQQRPQSVAYFCPECGDVWARAVIEGVDYSPWSMSCSKHPRFRSLVAGSLWMDWDKDYTKAFPRAVLERELQMHLAHYDRYKELP